MEAAFLGFLSFASKNLVDQYEEECGPINLSAGGIDGMIDKATGRDMQEAQRFVDWCVGVFGTPEQITG